jgi:hypothetical protein
MALSGYRVAPRYKCTTTRRTQRLHHKHHQRGHIRPHHIKAARFQEWLEFAKVYDPVPVNFFDFQQLYTAAGERLAVKLPEA